MIPFAASSVAGRRATFIDLRTWGTLTRPGEASYLHSAPTDGSTLFMRWAGYGARRVEDRGDGNGEMLLIEGASKNWVYSSPGLGAGNWSLSGTGVIVSQNSFIAPDGSKTAHEFTSTGGQNWADSNVLAGVTTGLPWVGYYWVKHPSSAGTAQGLAGAGGSVRAGGISTTTTWAKLEIPVANQASNSVGLYLTDSRNLTSLGGIAAGNRDEVVWGMQLEQAYFSTSYVRSADNASLPVTRVADVLSGAMSTVPSAMINGAFTFTVAPVFSSAAGISAAADQCIFSFAEDDSERIYFYVSAGSIYIRVVSGGVEKVKSSALTFSAHQKLTVTVNGTAGSITVSGATTGNSTATGTGWTRTTGATMYVGSRQGGTEPLFGRLGPMNSQASQTKIALFMAGQSNMQVNSITSKILGAVQATYPNALKFEWCVGGTGLYSDWDPSTGATYAAAKAYFQGIIANTPHLADYTPIFIWGQGENDSDSPIHATPYGTNLANFFTHLETDVPFLAGCRKIVHLLSPTCAIDPTGPTFTNCALVRSGEAAYQAAHPTLVTTVETSDLTKYDGTGGTNGVHYDDASTTILAARDAAVIAGYGL